MPHAFSVLYTICEDLGNCHINSFACTSLDRAMHLLLNMKYLHEPLVTQGTKTEMDTNIPASVEMTRLGGEPTTL
jgi:hypothetical protein